MTVTDFRDESKGVGLPSPELERFLRSRRLARNGIELNYCVTPTFADKFHQSTSTGVLNLEYTAVFKTVTCTCLVTATTIPHDCITIIYEKKLGSSTSYKIHSGGAAVRITIDSDIIPRTGYKSCSVRLPDETTTPPR